MFSSDNKGLDGICLCVIGVSGAGKTALMAKLAETLYDLDEKVLSRPVIVRFCGTSKGSATALSLMDSICRQLLFVYDKCEEMDSIPKTFDAMVKFFHQLLATYPVILIIDSLDQLTNDNLARSHISFLYGVNPHRHSRLIVSALPDEKDLDGKWIYCYGCDTSLAKKNVSRVLVPKLDTRNLNETRHILSSLLLRCEIPMQITGAQMEYALTQISMDPTALYLKLAMRIIQDWKSHDDVKGTLPPTVPSLIAKIFESLEETYGKVFVCTALALLTFSVGGLTDQEMKDALSLYEDVLNSLFQYSDPGERIFPPHIWWRFRAALEGLLVERDGGCLGWYHRQLKEAAERRYSSGKRRAHEVTHGTMKSTVCD